MVFLVRHTCFMTSAWRGLISGCSQFEVTTPHVAYACLGGFVVIVSLLLELDG